MRHLKSKLSVILIIVATAIPFLLLWSFIALMDQAGRPAF